MEKRNARVVIFLCKKLIPEKENDAASFVIIARCATKRTGEKEKKFLRSINRANRNNITKAMHPVFFLCELIFDSAVGAVSTVR